MIISIPTTIYTVFSSKPKLAGITSIRVIFYDKFKYEVCPEDSQSYNVKNRDIYSRRYKMIQDGTRNIVHRTMTPQSPSK